MIYPIVSSISYISISYILKLNKLSLSRLYKTNKTYNSTLKIIGAIYNLIMTCFSLSIFFVMSRLLTQEYGTMTNHNVWFSKRIIENQDILYVCWIFLHSKTVEYFDTFFILLKGGSPIFLQKFHHFGAVWCWYVLVCVDSSAAIVPTLYNSFVHSLMYLYYFLSVFDRKKILSRFKPIMTSVQLMQLTFGFYAGLFDYTIKHCQNTFNDQYIIASLSSLFYGFCLMMLFLQFSFVNYIHKKQVKDI